MQGRNRDTNVWTQEGKAVGWGEGRWWWDEWEIGIDMYTLICIKWTTNKDLLYSTGKSTQYSVMKIGRAHV